MQEETEIHKLKAGDYLINLGIISEIEEEEIYFSMVIERLDQRQVFKFNKTDMLLIRRQALPVEPKATPISAGTIT